MRKFIPVHAPNEFSGMWITDAVMSDDFLMWLELKEVDLQADFSFVDPQGIVIFREREDS